MSKLPNLDKLFIIQVDASDMMVREVLLQKNSKGTYNYLPTPQGIYPRQRDIRQ